MTDYRFNRRIATGVRTLTEEEFKELHPKYQPGMRVVMLDKGQCTHSIIGVTRISEQEHVRRVRVTLL